MFFHEFIESLSVFPRRHCCYLLEVVFGRYSFIIHFDFLFPVEILEVVYDSQVDDVAVGVYVFVGGGGLVWLISLSHPTFDHQQ